MGFIFITLVSGSIGGWLALTGLSRLGRLKAVSGSVRTVCGGIFAAVGASSALLGFNFVTYDRLTNERPAANISFVQNAAQNFTAKLEIPGEEPIALDITGDEWRLDARFIKWHPLANIGGLDAYYRLERITGRYRDTEQEISDARSVYALHENPGWDIWTLARDKRMANFKVLDAYYGNSVYAPMKEGAEFDVFATQNGLIVRPGNEVADNLLADWK